MEMEFDKCTPCINTMATGFRPPSATLVSAEPFSHGTGTLRCLQKEMATYRHWSVSLWRDPDVVSHCRILSPDKTEWRLISATLCGWRRRFAADQLWLMKHIREEKDYHGQSFWQLACQYILIYMISALQQNALWVTKVWDLLMIQL